MRLAMFKFRGVDGSFEFASSDSKFPAKLQVIFSESNDNMNMPYVLYTKLHKIITEIGSLFGLFAQSQPANDSETF